jgi:Fic family protein
VPPPPEALPECLDLLEKYLHSPKRLDSLVEAFIVHYQFEAIHPFRDGNGRVGRLLLAVTIMEWCGLSNQWLYMSAYFDRNRDEYIDRLLRVSTHAEWEEWISFCLKGVIEQAADTEKRCDKLLEVQRMFKDRIRGVGGSFRLTEIVDDLLLVVPILHIPYLAHKFNVTYPTAKADVDRLLKANILKELPGARRKAFYAPEVVSIIYGDID